LILTSMSVCAQWAFVRVRRVVLLFYYYMPVQ
jgi:hypothetical protein